MQGLLGKSFLKAFFWAILIFIASAISGNTLDTVRLFPVPFFDKFAHFTMYFLLSLFMAAGFYKLKNKYNIFHLFVILVICTAYGGLLEILQESLFHKRAKDIYDFWANCAGALVASLLFRKIYKRKFWRKVL